jgi:hypothetical protein
MVSTRANRRSLEQVTTYTDTAAASGTTPYYKADHILSHFRGRDTFCINSKTKCADGDQYLLLMKTAVEGHESEAVRTLLQEDIDTVCPDANRMLFGCVIGTVSSSTCAVLATHAGKGRSAYFALREKIHPNTGFDSRTLRTDCSTFSFEGLPSTGLVELNSLHTELKAMDSTFTEQDALRDVVEAVSRSGDGMFDSLTSATDGAVLTTAIVTVFLNQCDATFRRITARQASKGKVQKDNFPPELLRAAAMISNHKLNTKKFKKTTPNTDGPSCERCGMSNHITTTCRVPQHKADVYAETGVPAHRQNREPRQGRAAALTSEDLLASLPMESSLPTSSASTVSGSHAPTAVSAAAVQAGLSSELMRLRLIVDQLSSQQPATQLTVNAAGDRAPAPAPRANAVAGTNTQVVSNPSSSVRPGIQSKHVC